MFGIRCYICTHKTEDEILDWQTEIKESLEKQLPAPYGWLRSLFEAGFDKKSFLIAYSFCTRRFGKNTLVSSGEWGKYYCHTDTAARALLLDFSAKSSEANFPRFLNELWRCADSREQIACLKCFPLLANPKEYLFYATDSCRTNMRDLFEAIACENSYPVEHFDDHSLNHLVMKAVLMQISPNRILGLKKRLNADLARMACDYAEQMESASRAFSPDMLLLFGFSKAGERAFSKLEYYLEHNNHEYRNEAVKALGGWGGTRALDLLKSRLQSEKDSSVAECIGKILTEKPQ